MKLFTYGTLRPSLYPHRLLPGMDPVRATLTAQLQMFNLGHFPALIEVEEGGRGMWGEIVGEVITIPDIKMYDAYEGYTPDGKGLYDRAEFAVTLDSGETCRAWVYFMHRLQFFSGDSRQLVVSGDWADIVRRRPPLPDNDGDIDVDVNVDVEGE